MHFALTIARQDSNLTRDLALLLTHAPADELEKKVAIQASQLLTVILCLDSGLQVTHLGQSLILQVATLIAADAMNAAFVDSLLTLVEDQSVGSLTADVGWLDV